MSLCLREHFKEIGFNDQEAPLDVSLNILWGFKILSNMTKEIFKYSGNDVTFRLENGVLMVNATQMAKPFSSLPKDWLRTAFAQKMIDAISVRQKCLTGELVVVMQGGDIQGTWMQEDVALLFAQWLSPELYLWCNDKIKELLTKGSVSLPNFNNPAEAARAWADQYERRELAEKKVFELEPKAEVFDKISNADNLLSMNSAAKSLGTTRTKLFKLLREKDILMANNLPYQRHIDAGRFQVKVKPIEMGDKSMDYAQTFVTAKGLTWLGRGFVNLDKQK